MLHQDVGFATLRFSKIGFLKIFKLFNLLVCWWIDFDLHFLLFLVCVKWVLPGISGSCSNLHLAYAFKLFMLSCSAFLVQAHYDIATCLSYGS